MLDGLESSQCLPTAHPGVFTLPSALSSAQCQDLVARVRAHSPDPNHGPPTIFGHRGAVLDDLGLGDDVQALARALDPIVQRAMPGVGPLRSTDVLGVVLFSSADHPEDVHATPLHRDESCVTLSVCVGAGDLCGGDLVFASDQEHSGVSIAARVGQGVLFKGATPHSTTPVTSGWRAALVVWVVSEGKAQREGKSLMDEYRAYLANAVHTDVGRMYALDVPVAYSKAERAKPPTTLGDVASDVMRHLSLHPPQRAATQQQVSDIGSCVLGFLNDGGEPEPSRSCPQYITLHLGDSGVELPSSLWELFCAEHGIGEDGRVVGEGGGEGDGYERTNSAAFTLSLSGVHRPRAVLCGVDLAPRSLFYPEQCVAGGAGAEERLMDLVRVFAEDCDNLHGFYVHHALGSWLGAGLLARVLPALGAEFAKKPKFAVSVLADVDDGPTASRHHSVVALAAAQVHTDLFTLLSKQALRGVCSSALGWQPSARNCGALAAQAVSDWTITHRVHDSALNPLLSEAVTSLVPFPVVNLCTTAIAPLFPNDSGVTSICKLAATREHCLSGVGADAGPLMGCNLLFRGPVVPKDVMAAVGALKTMRTFQFVDWAPTGFRCGTICGRVMNPNFHEPNALAAPISVAMLSNNTAVGDRVYDRVVARSVEAKEGGACAGLGDEGDGAGFWEDWEAARAVCVDAAAAYREILEEDGEGEEV